MVEKKISPPGLNVVCTGRPMPTPAVGQASLPVFTVLLNSDVVVVVPVLIMVTLWSLSQWSNITISRPNREIATESVLS